MKAFSLPLGAFSTSGYMTYNPRLQYSDGPFTVPVARYNACEIAWHKNYQQ